MEQKVLNELSEIGLIALIEDIKFKLADVKIQIKEQKVIVKQAEVEKSANFYFEDCSDFYIKELELEQEKLNDLISEKISLEKYLKKIKKTKLEIYP